MENEIFNTDAYENVIRFLLDAGENINNKIFEYDLNSTIGTMFEFGREFFTGGLKKKTFGNTILLNTLFKINVSGFYTVYTRSNLTDDEFDELLTYFCYLLFKLFNYYAEDDNDLYNKIPIIKDMKIFFKHYKEQLAIFHTLVMNFDNNNYLIPFVINKTKKEFSNNDEYYIARKMSAILAEDLCLDHSLRNFSATFNFYSGKKIPTMSRQFYRACEPFYEFIYKELFEKEQTI